MSTRLTKASKSPAKPAVAKPAAKPVAKRYRLPKRATSRGVLQLRAWDPVSRARRPLESFSNIHLRLPPGFDESAIEALREELRAVASRHGILAPN